MSWWRRRSAGAASGGRAEYREEVTRVRDHLQSFISSRRGVEAFIEPATTVTPPTVILVAATGEWTRRRLPGPGMIKDCLLYTSPSPRDQRGSRMPSSA